MAFRTWAQTLGTAAGAAFLAAAGQLGVGSGLGLLRWDADFSSRSAWHTQLTWLAFLTALATVAGAAAAMWAPAGFTGSSAAEREPRSVRAALAVAAAIGAAAVIPIGTHPARGVHIPEPGGAGHAAVLAMLLGVVLGLAVAYATLAVPAIGGNVVTYAIWLWLAALASALWSLGRHGQTAPAAVTGSAGRLGLLPPAGGWTATVLLLVVPGAIGFLAASVSRFGGGGRLAVAYSGAAGPVLVAGAYLIGGRGGGTQSVAYWCAIGGVAVGAAASAFVALARRDRGTPLPTRPYLSPRPEVPGYPADWDSSEDSDDERGGSGLPGPRHESDHSGSDYEASGYPTGGYSAGGYSWGGSAGSGSTGSGYGATGGADHVADALRSPTDDHTTTGSHRFPEAWANGPDQDGGDGPDPDRFSAVESTGGHHFPSWETRPAVTGESALTGVASLDPPRTSASVLDAPLTSSTVLDAPRTSATILDAPVAGSGASTFDTPRPAAVEPPPVPAPHAPVEDLWSSTAQRAAEWNSADLEAPRPAAPGTPRWSVETPRERTTTDRGTRFFESAPAPDVPSAPSSRARTGSLFDPPAGPELDDFAPVNAERPRFGSARESDQPTGRTAAEPAGRHASDWPEPTPSSPQLEALADAPTSPAPAGPAWPEHAADDESAPESAAEPDPATPTGKAGRRGRRRGAAQEAPAVRPKDADYVDWFKDLRGSGRS